MRFISRLTGRLVSATYAARHVDAVEVRYTAREHAVMRQAARQAQAAARRAAAAVREARFDAFVASLDAAGLDVSDVEEYEYDEPDVWIDEEYEIAVQYGER